MFESHQTDYTLTDVMFFQLYVMSQKFCYFILFCQEKPMNPQQSLSGPKEDEEGMFFMIFLQFSLSLNKFSTVFVTTHFSSQKFFPFLSQGHESQSSAYLSNYSFSTSDFSCSLTPTFLSPFSFFLALLLFGCKTSWLSNFLIYFPVSLLFVIFF